MASYLERSQILPVQQVLPPSESMLKMFQTRLDLYGRGAAMINNQESRIRQSKFTRDSSKETFSALMNQVDANLKQSSTMDFSIMDNVTMAAHSFDPLYKDTPQVNNMWGDKYTTEKLNKDISLAESQKGTDKFNQAGYDWATAKKEMFRLDPRDESWKLYSTMAGDYTEYYDKTGEMKELAQLYDKYSKDNLEYEYPDPNNPGYNKYMKNQSFSGEDFSAFVMANGSSKLKKQLKDDALGDYGKYFTGVHNTALAPEEKVASINNAYREKFEFLKQSRVNTLDQKGREAMIAINGLDKNAPDYHQKLEQAQTYLRNIEDAKRNAMAEKFDETIGTFQNPAQATNFVTNLHLNDWYNKMGKSWDKKDIVEKMTEDNVYWNRLNYNFNVTKFNESVRQFEKTFDQNERAMIMKANIEAEKLKFGYLKEGLNPDGTPKTPESAGSYAVPEVTDPDKKLTPEEIGKREMERMQSIIDTNAATTYNTLLKMYFKQGDSKLSETFFDELNKPENLNTPLSTLTTSGGLQMKEEVLNYLTNYKVTSSATGKPYTRDQLLSMTSGEIMKLLHRTLDNPKNLDLFKKLAKDKDNGIEILHGINDLEEYTRNLKNNYNSKHGFEVSKELKNIGWPSYVSPEKDKDLWDAGVRGYEQDGPGKYRVPTEAEIVTFMRSNKVIGKPGGIPDILKRNFPVTSTILAQVTNLPVIGGTTAISWENQTLSKIRSAIGAKGEPELNKLETPINYGDMKKGSQEQNQTKNMILSVLNNPQEAGEEAEKLRAFALQNIDRVSSVLLRSDRVTGEVTMGLLFNKSDNAIISALEQFNFNNSVPQEGKIYLKVSNKSLIPKQFFKEDPEYLDALQAPLSFTRTYNLGDRTQPHVITLRNEGTYNSPSFSMTGTMMMPVIQDGTFARDQNGNAIGNTYSVKDDVILAQLGMTKEQFDIALQRDPVVLKDKIKSLSTRLVETINFLNGEAKGLTLTQIYADPLLSRKFERINKVKY